MPWTITKDDYTEANTRKPALQIRADIRSASELSELREILSSYDSFFTPALERVPNDDK